MKIILLALFSAALVQGQPIGPKPKIPPHTLAPVHDPLKDPRIIFTDNRQKIPAQTAVLKTKADDSWMHISPFKDTETGKTNHFVTPLATRKDVKIIETNPGLTKPGHAALMQGDGSWKHYESAEGVLPQPVIERANQRATEFVNMKADSKTRPPAPSRNYGSQLLVKPYKT